MSISVILPTYNRAHFISKAIQSVMEQLTSTDELIIIDDGSTDNTQKTIQDSFNYPNIRYIKTENRGAGAARNLGIKESKGDFIAFIDSDNYWLPGKLDVQIKIMEAHKDLICCFTDFIATKNDGKTYSNGIKFWLRNGPDWIAELKHVDKLDNIVKEHTFKCDHSIHYGNMYSALINGNYIPVWTSLVRKKTLEDSCLFATDVSTWEEWEFFGRIAQIADVAFVDIETVHNIAHDDPRLTDAGFINRIESELKILKRVWGSDEEFLNLNGQMYNDTLKSKILILINHYLRIGQVEKAVKLLSQKCELPFRYKLLKFLPINLLSMMKHI